MAFDCNLLRSRRRWFQLFQKMVSIEFFHPWVFLTSHLCEVFGIRNTLRILPMCGAKTKHETKTLGPLIKCWIRMAHDHHPGLQEGSPESCMYHWHIGRHVWLKAVKYKPSWSCNSWQKDAKGKQKLFRNYILSWHDPYLETPCRKIFDTRVFSGKKGDKGTKRWHFRKKGTKQKCKSYAISCDVAKLLAGNFRHNSANFWHNSGNFRYKKKSLSRKRLYRRMMTAEPLPRALNLKKRLHSG